MSQGSGSTKRSHMTAKRAAKLAADGYTHRQIAELIGKPPEAVKKTILLGQRLLQVEDKP